MIPIHPSNHLDNADLVAEVRALGYRVLAAIRVLRPEIYHNVWELRSMVVGGGYSIAGDFLLTCGLSRWIKVSDISGPRTFLVFNAYLGDGPLEFSWDPHVCRNFVAPALQRVLLLDDLAAL